MGMTPQVRIIKNSSDDSPACLEPPRNDGTPKQSSTDHTHHYYNSRHQFSKPNYRSVTILRRLRWLTYGVIIAVRENGRRLR